ncbi:MAG: LuxR C-terminal-related transcriptional regulator [Chloroflexota bacterium]|nr:LuxR C-terminal-related transcriptional regulator [Chloroflexota bacterium]
MLGEVASKTPTLLLVEDVHWSDDASLELLRSFTRSLARRRLLLLLTYRSDEIGTALRQFLEGLDRERLARELSLVPLEPTEVAAMLRVTLSLDRSPPRDFLEQVSSLTEGNPFFIEELLRALIGDGQLARSGETWLWAAPAAELRVPRTVLAAVQRRSERLGEGAQRVLELASVIGQRFEFELLRSVSGLEESSLLDIVKQLIGAGLIVEVSAEQLAFRHALTRQAIVTQLLARERRRLHVRVAETLELAHPQDRDRHLAELAQHYHAAGLWTRALEDGRRAGQQALGLYAPGAAVAHFTRAIEAASRLSSSPDPGLLRARGQAREALGDFPRAQADYELALASASDPATIWQSLIDLGSLWAGRDYQQAGHWFERALEAARSTGDQRHVPRSLNRLGNWLVNIGRTAEGLELHRQALSLLETQMDQAGVAETVDLLAMALALDGDVVAGVEQFGRAVADFRAAGDVRGLASSLTSYTTFGAPLLAETSAASLRTLAQTRLAGHEALDLARQSGSPAAQAYAHFAMAQALNGYGELGEALEHGLTARGIADDIDHQQWRAAACCVLGESYLFALAPDPALSVLTTGYDLARELRSGWWMGIAATYLALAYLLAGENARARATVQSAWPRDHVPANASERRVAWAWGELALADRDPEQALVIAQGLLVSAPGGMRGQGVPWLHKLAGEAQLAIGRLDEAFTMLELARQGAIERAQRPALWQVHRALARLHLTRQAHDAAFAELEQARAHIDALATTLGPELHAAMIEHAQALLPHEPAAAARRAEAQRAGGLSVREREVAKQVALGRSNREIAEALIVGDRTVETHVSSILSKLGLKSRRQIATWLAQQGPWPPPAP